ncbi:MAG: hypothetical protein Q9190_001427 [Brigantiaea leucoxantha]
MESMPRQRRSSAKDAFNISLLKALIVFGTLPYYRLFNFNTLQPILSIAASTREPVTSRHLVRLMTRWRTRKLAELQFISLACAIIAAAVIGSFSWEAVRESYWLASAFWYCSLGLAILGVMIAAQQVTILEILGVRRTQKGDPMLTTADVRRYLPLMLTQVHPTQDGPRSSVDINMGPQREVQIGEWRPRWKMVFTWQVPVMFMSYSACLFIAGLTIYICTPLLRGEEWSPSSNIAVVYLAVVGIAGAIFEFCSFWGYHYVDLGHWPEDEYEAEGNTSPIR